MRSFEVGDLVIDLPTEWDERFAWEAESRGVLDGVVVQDGDGNRFRATIYDPVRLRQDLEEEMQWDRPFVVVPGLIVVPSVTRACIERAFGSMLGGDLALLLPRER